MQKFLWALISTLALVSCSESSLVTIRINTGFKLNPTKNLMSGLVTLGASDSRSSCIQNNVVLAYGLANSNSDLISTQSISFVTPFAGGSQTIDSLWLAQNASVGNISVSIPRNVNYNVGMGGSIVSPVAANADGTCTTESTVAGDPPELLTTTIFGYSTINKSDNADLSLKLWVIPPKTDLPPPTLGSVCANQSGAHDQNAQVCPNNNFSKVICPSCYASGYSLRFSYLASMNGRPPVIQNFDSSLFTAGGVGAFVPSKKPYNISVISNGNVIGSADYTSASAYNDTFSIPISGSALPVSILDASRLNEINLRLSGGPAILKGTCSPITVSLVDYFGNAFKPSAGAVINLSLVSPPSTASLYSDSFCANLLGSSISIPANSSSVNIYVRDTGPVSATFALNAFTTLTTGAITSANLNITTKMATAISAGYHHTCAIISDEVQCWGLNSSGQLGNKTTTYSPSPVKVVGLPSGVTAVSAGYNFTCAVVGGAAYCWGSNSSGQLGDGGASGNKSYSPVQVSGLLAGSGVTAISTSGGDDGSGGATTCALVNGVVNCWGRNTYGQVGDGSTTSRSVPAVVGLTSVISISVGASTSCGIKSPNNLYCWGGNSNGELGVASPSFTPSPFGIGASYGNILSSFNSHTCSINSGVLYCWGLNSFGQAGALPLTYKSVPTVLGGITVSAAATSSSISVGGLHTCAINNGGAVFCWGDNSMGQFGTGSPSSSTVPIPSTILSGASSITSGSYHSCTIMNGSGPILCWGSNTYGELGNGTTSLPTTANPNPMPVFGFQ